MRHDELDDFFQFNPQTLEYEPVLWRRSIIPAWLTFDEYVTRSLPFTTAASGAPPKVTAFRQNRFSVQGIHADLLTPFLAESVVFEDSTDTTDLADFTVDIRGVGDAIRYMNAPVHIRNLAGTAQYPAILREQLFVPSGFSIQMLVEKITGGATTMRFYFAGSNFYPWGPDLDAYPEGSEALKKLVNRWMLRRKYVTPYWLSPDLSPLNFIGNDVQNALCKIGDDGHFEAFAIVAVSTGDFSIEIQDVRSKRQIMNAAISKNAGIGTAQKPTLFAVPYLMPSDSKLNLKVTDLSGTTNKVWITLQGRKIFAPLKDVQEVLRSTAVRTPADNANDQWPATLPEEMTLQGMGGRR